MTLSDALVSEPNGRSFLYLLLLNLAVSLWLFWFLFTPGKTQFESPLTGSDSGRAQSASTVRVSKGGPVLSEQEAVAVAAGAGNLPVDDVGDESLWRFLPRSAYLQGLVVSDGRLVVDSSLMLTLSALASEKDLARQARISNRIQQALADQYGPDASMQFSKLFEGMRNYVTVLAGLQGFAPEQVSHPSYEEISAAIALLNHQEDRIFGAESAESLFSVQRAERAEIMERAMRYLP